MSGSPLGAGHRALTIGILMMVTVVAFQALGVGTALPAVARDLGGFDAYGWAFSAFLLPSIVGMVGAGQLADARGPVRPFLAAVVAFAAGCVLAAAAGTWTVLLAGRALQGLGNGAVGSLVYVAVARAYPPELYGRMMALLSSAWVLPSLIGPAVGGLVADHLGWRWVFLLLLPLLPVSAVLALIGLRTLERDEAVPVESRLRAALELSVGLGLVLGAPQAGSALVAAGLALGGLALGAPAFRRLLPEGTLRARPGLPAGIAVRGLIAVGYLGGDAFLPLALVRLHALSLSQAGLVVSAGSLSWCLGAIYQGRLDRRDGGAGRPRRIVLGGVALTVGVAIAAAGLAVEGLSVAVPATGWVVAGLGIGMSYPSAGALALSQAPAGTEGNVAAALVLIETIFVAVFTGGGGALLAAGLDHDWGATTAIGLVFAAAAVAAAAALPTARRVAVA